MRKLSVIFCVMALLLFVMPIAASSNATNFDEGQSISALSVLRHSIEDAGLWLMDVRQDVFNASPAALSPGHEASSLTSAELTRVWQHIHSLFESNAR